MSQEDELRAAPGEQTSRRSFALERALVVGTGAALLSRTPSLVPRTAQDQALISAGAGLMGAASGLLAEGALAALGRGLPGGRKGAAVVLGGLAAGALAWASARRRSRAAAAADTAGRVLLAAGPAGEVALSAYGRLPSQQRRDLAGKVWTTALAAATAIAALRQKLAEPRDLVKASIRYDFLPSVSGGEASLLPLARIDREGRQFLGNAVPAARIETLMGGDAIDPIRVFAGLESAETPAERARLVVAELERLGGLERRRILFLCPTGSGKVNLVAAAAEELMSRGDVASVAVQYSHLRSVRARKHVKVARETWRLLLEELDRRLDELPPERRPEVAVYGESLGAQVVAEALFEGGAQLLTALQIGRGALLGVPFAGTKKLLAIRRRGEPEPEGLGVFSDLEELIGLRREEQERLRYILFTHAEDPVANFSGSRLLWERPRWLEPEGRHPRLPSGMRWLPGITFLHVLFDVKNGTSFTPQFEAYAHDYRLELPTLLRIAFGHADVSDEQLAAIERETAQAAVAQAEREARARSGPRPR